MCISSQRTLNIAANTLIVAVFIPALVYPPNSTMKMTRAQALLVLEEEERPTADEIKQAYKKLALKWYTHLFKVLQFCPLEE